MFFQRIITLFGYLFWFLIPFFSFTSSDSAMIYCWQIILFILDCFTKRPGYWYFLSTSNNFVIMSKKYHKWMTVLTIFLQVVKPALTLFPCDSESKTILFHLQVRRSFIPNGSVPCTDGTNCVKRMELSLACRWNKFNVTKFLNYYFSLAGVVSRLSGNRSCLSFTIAG